MNDENYGKWVTLKEEMQKCSACELCSEKRVLGFGDKTANVMLVTEKPFGESDFSGEEDGLLLNMLTLVGIEKSSIYKTSLINCISEKPLSEKAKNACINCLRKEFSLVKPQVVVCVGKKVSETLIGANFNLQTSHGSIIGKGKTMFMGVISPKIAMKNIAQRELLFCDFIKLYEHLKTYPPVK